MKSSAITADGKYEVFSSPTSSIQRTMWSFDRVPSEGNFRYSVNVHAS